MTRTWLLSIALLAIVPCTASAATVDVRVGERGAEAYYAAAPGERNEVLFSAVDDYTLRVADPGATIVPGPGCRSIDEHTAECTSVTENTRPYLYAAHVLAGDMDDVVRSSHERAPGISGPTALSGPGIIGDGGPGDDMLVGSSDIADELDGGGGRDRLFGHGNSDTLVDGDVTGSVDADMFDGGGDRDTVSYARRTGPVAVDLSDSQPDGEADEGDVLTSVEHVTGGSGDDELTGGDGINFLRGGEGDDRILGGDGVDNLGGEGGDDRLYGQDGADGLSGGDGTNRLSGGNGRDGLFAEGGTDALSCASGVDAVVGAEARDLLSRTCETLRYDYGSFGETHINLTPVPRDAGRGVVRFSIGCPYPDELDGECGEASGKLTLRHARTRRALGSGTLTEAQGRRTARTERPASVAVRLTARGRALARRRKGVRTTVSMRGQNLPTVRWTVLMRAR